MKRRSSCRQVLIHQVENHAVNHNTHRVCLFYANQVLLVSNCVLSVATQNDANIGGSSLTTTHRTKQDPNNQEVRGLRFQP